MSTSSITDKQLDRALQLARQKLRIRWTILAILFLIAAGSLLFAANGAFHYFSQSNSYQQAMADAWKADPSWTTAQRQPQELIVGSSYLWPRGNNRYDLAAEIENSNDHWAAQRLNFDFIQGDRVVASETTVLLPKEKRLLTALGIITTTTIDHIDSVRVTKVDWRYVAADSSQWWLLPADPVFQPRTVSGDGAASLPHITWQAQNNTSHNLRQVVWQIILRTGGQVQQVVEYTARNVDYGVMKQYDVALSQDVIRPDQVTVVPISDIFDSANSFLPSPDQSLPADRGTTTGR